MNQLVIHDRIEVSPKQRKNRTVEDAVPNWAVKNRTTEGCWTCISRTLAQQTSAIRQVYSLIGSRAIPSSSCGKEGKISQWLMYRKSATSFLLPLWWNQSRAKGKWKAQLSIGSHRSSKELRLGVVYEKIALYVFEWSLDPEVKSTSPIVCKPWDLEHSQHPRMEVNSREDARVKVFGKEVGHGEKEGLLEKWKAYVVYQTGNGKGDGNIQRKNFLIVGRTFSSHHLCIFASYMCSWFPHYTH